MSGMREIAEIRRRLAAMCASGSGETFPATVRYVDADRRTCRVEVEGITYDDVLLYAVDDASKRGFCFLPASESTVLVSRIGGSNELYVVMFSEVDEVRLTVGESVETKCTTDGIESRAGDTTLRLTEAGFTLSRNDSGLLATLEKLLDALCALTVTTAVGPSGTPVNAGDFVKIKEDLKNYLKG